MDDHHFSYISRLKFKKNTTHQLVHTEIITLTPALGGNLIFLINRQSKSLKEIHFQKTTGSKYFDFFLKMKFKKKHWFWVLRRRRK